MIRLRRCGLFLLITLLMLASWPAAAQAQDTEDGPPLVTAAAMPLYPTIAVAARVWGVVKIKVTTDGKSVVSLETVSGPAMLVEAAKKNINTWTFDQHKRTSFVTTFEFNFTDPPSCTYTNPRVSAQLPLEVSISIRRLQTCDPTATVNTTKGRRAKKN